MKTWLTAIVGGGAVAVLYSMRRYIGFALVLLVTTCSFKGDIVNYMTTTRDQAHQERLAQIARDEATARIAAEREQALIAQQTQAAQAAQAAQIQADAQARQDQIRLERDRRRAAAQAEITRVTAMRANAVRQQLQTALSNPGLSSDYGRQVQMLDTYLAQQRQIVAQNR